MDDMDKIYQKYAQYVYKYLMSLSHDPSIAEELTQETFYQALKSIDHFDGRSNISTWLVGIARIQYQVYLRKNPKHENIDDQLEEPSIPATPESDFMTHISRVQILKMLHNCEEPHREILYLRMFEDLSFKEIGEIMGKSENWARVTYYRGKEKLKKEYENYVRN